MGQCGRIGAGLLAVLLVAMAATAQPLATTTPDAAAWQALKDRQYGLAFDLFDAASAESPRDASLQFGAGVAHLMRGRNIDARARFEAALAIDPGLTDASILLGQALYRDGDIAGATAVYGRAVGHAPGDPELVEPLTRWRREIASDQTLEALDGAHFVVRFHASDRDLASAVLTVAEAAHVRLERLLAARPDRPIAIVLYTPQEFAATTRLPEWAAGLYDGRIKVPLGGRALMRETDLARVIDHEVVHAIVASTAGPTVPAWLNEGLATALEPGGLAWARAFDTPSTGHAFPPPSSGFRGLMPPEARLAYAQSTRAVQQLIDHRGTEGIVALLRAIGRGVPFADAFRESMGATLEELGAPGATH